jgi:hypothetical protein
MEKRSNDPDIFNAGKQFLSYPPVRKFMREAAKTDVYWQEALKFIKNPEAMVSCKPPKCLPPPSI